MPWDVSFKEQGWLLVDLIGFTDHDDITVWNGYLACLKTSHVRLSFEVDHLIWNQSKSGKYTPSIGYLQFTLDRNEEEISWSWKVLWKLKCPLKTKIYSWFILSDKALTWDIICRKGREGPGRSYLCKLELETNLHLGVECNFTQSVWYELEVKLNKSNL